MNKTKIQWCDRVWNPVTGCTPINAGCLNCYAKRMAETRLRGRCGYDKDDPFKVKLHYKRLSQPSEVKKPQRVFVCSMGDLFHKDVEDAWLIDVFMEMFKEKQHTYVLLTKRPERMVSFLKHYDLDQLSPEMRGHIWLGVSISTNADLWMVDKLLEIKAAVRFVSIEPMLTNIHPEIIFPSIGLDWVICGAETGPGKRHYESWWGELMRNVCKRANTPFFFKQDGDGNNTIDGKTYQEYPK